MECLCLFSTPPPATVMTSPYASGSSASGPTLRMLTSILAKLAPSRMNPLWPVLVRSLLALVPSASVIAVSTALLPRARAWRISGERRRPTNVEPSSLKLLAPRPAPRPGHLCPGLLPQPSPRPDLTACSLTVCY